MELALLAGLVDEYTVARDLRLAADKEAAALKTAEVKLKTRVIDELIRNDATMVGGSTHRVTLQVKSKVQAEDWSAIHKYMIENDAMDIQQRRLHAGAIDDRLEEGEEIPGIVFIQINDLSVAKL